MPKLSKRLLLAFVLFVPALEGLFLVAPVNGFQVLCIVVLAFLPTLLIQLSRVIRGK